MVRKNVIFNSILPHTLIHIMFSSSHTCCVTIICVNESVPNYYSKEIIHPLYVLDKLTNTHNINLKGQFFGCLDELMLVWCHHQLLFSTHACHTRIKILAHRTRTLLFFFYMAFTFIYDGTRVEFGHQKSCWIQSIFSTRIE